MGSSQSQETTVVPDHSNHHGTSQGQNATQQYPNYTNNSGNFTSQSPIVVPRCTDHDGTSQGQNATQQQYPNYTNNSRNFTSQSPIVVPRCTGHDGTSQGQNATQQQYPNYTNNSRNFTSQSPIVVPRCTDHDGTSQGQNATQQQYRNYTNNSTSKPTVPVAESPKKINNVEELKDNWFFWKLQFFAYVDSMNIAYDKLGVLLLNLMGPVGQQVCRSFAFDDYHNESQDIMVLVSKFDFYVLFGNRTKRPDENIATYVEELLKLVASKGLDDGPNWVLKKLFEEVDKDRFTNITISMYPSFNKNLNSLTLTQVCRIWSVYEKLLLNDNPCDKCNKTHEPGDCPATGKQCWKCKEWNHFASICKASFIVDCRFCAMSHRNKCCPAYGKTCELCNKKNHFSTRCQINKSLLCRYCNSWHIQNRAVCPAKNNICGKCKRMGHYQLLCPETHL